ncbi:beta-ketoacyl synthase N-terminal-like domain-containing protein [Sorangium sp. So ce854]|uniref:beta-ketoacyl synthase N-terminal-like domain-containing protein n=1 Tax=Sorangium sp. So ce854 TaxID=3133322 RepID=UPI003F61E5E1
MPEPSAILSPLPVVDAVIVGVGARSPAGLTALQVAMSARAMKFTPRASHMIDKNGDLIAMGRVMSIGDHVFGINRLLSLATPSLLQATYAVRAGAAGQRRAPGPLPLFVALPSRTRPGFDARAAQHLLAALEARSQVPIDHDSSRLIFGCRGGGAAAVELALAELRRGKHDAVVVGGVDSYFDPDALDSLDQALRLHGPSTENGFIPGEGAGFLTLALRHRAGALERHGQLLSCAVEDEPRPYGSDEPCMARGVTQAIKRAASRALGAESRRIPWMLTDVANERHRVEEWTFGAMRNAAAFSADAVHEQPLLQTGDLGAASAAVLLAIAAVRWQTGCAPGDCVLVATHSDGPERGVIVASIDPSRRSHGAA